jgi:hypothetical protein
MLYVRRPGFYVDFDPLYFIMFIEIVTQQRPTRAALIDCLTITAALSISQAAILMIAALSIKPYLRQP